MDNLPSDPKSLSILSRLFPSFLERVLRVYARMEAEIGLPMKPTEGARSFARSNALVAAKKVIAAPAGLCFHNYCLAVDSCFLGADPYLANQPSKGVQAWVAFGKICFEEKLIWGGNWITRPDRPHCEFPIRPKTIHDIFAEYQRGKMVAVWKLLDTMIGVVPTWNEENIFNPEL